MPKYLVLDVTIIQRLAHDEFDITSYELNTYTVRRLILGTYFRNFQCAVPDCPIHSRETSTLYAIDPRLLVGYVIVPLCRQHAIQLVNEDASVTYGELTLALAVAYQAILGSHQTLVEISATTFRGRERPDVALFGRTALEQMIPSAARSKLMRRQKAP